MLLQYRIALFQPSIKMLSLLSKRTRKPVPFKLSVTIIEMAEFIFCFVKKSLPSSVNWLSSRIKPLIFAPVLRHRTVVCGFETKLTFIVCEFPIFVINTEQPAISVPEKKRQITFKK